MTMPAATASPCRNRWYAVTASVAEGVAEVEDHAATLLALVFGDHLGLDLAGTSYGVDQAHRVPAQQIVHVRLEPGEECRIGDDPVLDDLRQAGPELAFGKGCQHTHVGDHRPRLIEGADQVLSAGMIDRGLAAHGGIHEGEQRGRDLHQAHAALVGGGGESRHVADHAAAKGDHRRRAVVALVDQRVEYRRVRVQGLERFAVPDLDDVDAVHAHEAPSRLGKVEICDGGVGNDQGLLAGVRFEQIGGAEETVAEQDRVAALAWQRDVDSVAHDVHRSTFGAVSMARGSSAPVSRSWRSAAIAFGGRRSTVSARWATDS